MASFHFPIPSLLLGIGLLLQPCLAAEKVQVQFVSFPSVANPEPIELVTGDGSSIPVELPSNSVSDTYMLERPGRWSLGKSTLHKNGETKFSTYGVASMLAAKKQIIMVTRKGAAYSDGLIMTPFASDEDGFGGGKYLFFNASKVGIACEIGKTKFGLNPKSHKLIAPTPSAVKNERAYLYTKLYYRLENKIKPFYNSTWRFSEKARCMVFIYHDPHTQQLRTHSIRNFVW